MSLPVVYDTMLFLQAAVQPVRVHRSFQAVQEIHAQAEYLVTWGTRILNLPAEASGSGSMLQRLAPQLQIVNPEQFAQVLQRL